MDMVSPRQIFGGRNKSTKIIEGEFQTLQKLQTAHRKHPEHRRNLLYESHPAVTQVDGQPRVPSVRLAPFRFDFLESLSEDSPETTLVR